MQEIEVGVEKQAHSVVRIFPHAAESLKCTGTFHN